MLGPNKGVQSFATLAEILSQPEIWRQCLSELESSGAIREILDEAKSRTEWTFIGCGSSFYLAEAAAASWTMMTGQRARAVPAERRRSGSSA